MITFKSYALFIFMIIIFPSHFANAIFTPLSITSLMPELPQEANEKLYYINQYVDACFVMELHKIKNMLYGPINKEEKSTFITNNAEDFMITISIIYKFMDVLKDNSIKQNLFLAYKLLQVIKFNKVIATEHNYKIFQQYINNASNIELFESRVGDILEAAIYYKENIDQLCDYLVNSIYTNNQEADVFRYHLNNSNGLEEPYYKDHWQYYVMSSNIINSPNTFQARPNQMLIEHYKYLLCIYRDFMETIKKINGDMINLITGNNPSHYMSLIYEEFLTIYKYVLWLQHHGIYGDFLLKINKYLDIDFRDYFIQFIAEYNNIDNNGNIDLESLQSIANAIRSSNNMKKYYLFVTLSEQYNGDEPNYEVLNCNAFNWLYVYIDHENFKIEQPEMPLDADTYESLQLKFKIFKHRQMLSEYTSHNIVNQAPL